MNILADTSVWIEWLIAGHHAADAGHYLKQSSSLFVPSIVQYELFKWVLRERDETTALEVVALTEDCTVVPLDSKLAIFAARISLQHKLAMADAIVYATSLLNKATLITRDKHFAGLAGVKLI